MNLVFVDTHILAYARDPRDLRKQAIAMDWLRSLAHQRTGRLSWQVLIEFYAVATHPRKLAMVETAAQADVLALQAWNPVQPDAELLQRAWGVRFFLVGRHGGRRRPERRMLNAVVRGPSARAMYRGDADNHRPVCSERPRVRNVPELTVQPFGLKNGSMTAIRVHQRCIR